MEAPVKAAFIAATAAVIITVAQITSQWLLALRTEKANKPKEKPDIQKMAKYILRRTVTPWFILSVILQLFFIGKTVLSYISQPMPGIVVFFLCIQVVVLSNLILVSLMLNYYTVSLRYVLTGSLIRDDESA
jgi:hypothetical protein